VTAARAGPGAAAPPVYLVDASFFVFRAWFALPDTLTGPDGAPVNAVYGFASFLGDFLEDARPPHAAVAFDESLATCFRNAIYPAYKANREPAPPELQRQFAQCRAIAAAYGLFECADTRFEADDLIGTLADSARRRGQRVTIVSRDKDLVQLLGAGDALWDFAGRRTLTPADVPDAYGVRAEQMVDFLALAGDPVDNVPGVPGIGRKTAAALLAHFDDLDHLYADLDAVGALPVRGARRLAARLFEHREAAELARRLVRIRRDVPLCPQPDDLARRAPDLAALETLYDAAGFGSALRRQAERVAAAFGEPA